MKILFAGPSLYGRIQDERIDDHPSIRCLGPAQQGDLARAVLQGATAIGLVDGRYEDVAAVWHKEILFAIAEGVPVLGAASMGALRAAECEAFGMIGIGRVFELYRSGSITDDGDVAQLHGPAELGHLPLTEALVNVEATLDELEREAVLTGDEALRLRAGARGLFFKDRTYASVVAHAGFDPPQARRLLSLLEIGEVDIKHEDALLLVEKLAALEPTRRATSLSWTPAQPRIWRNVLHALRPDAVSLDTR